MTGCTPFFGDDLDEIIQKNTTATVCYEFQEIGIKISNNGIYFIFIALDLMKKLLNICPEKRPTAEKALAHAVANKVEAAYRRGDRGFHQRWRGSCGTQVHAHEGDRPRQNAHTSWR